jgi:hypothetical protein
MTVSTAKLIDFNTNGFGIEFLILGFKKIHKTLVLYFLWTATSLGVRLFPILDLFFYFIFFVFTKDPIPIRN